MAVNYTTQTKPVTLFNGVTLTASYGDNGSVIQDIPGMDAITLLCTYTTGSGETSNTMEIKIEAVDESGNAYQLINTNTSGGTTTITRKEFTYEDNTGAATTQRFAIQNIKTTYRRIKVSVKETGVAANFGTCTMAYTVSGQ